MSRFNCLLDGFPTEYKGYKINTSFRRGIAITLLVDDESLEESLKLFQAFKLLYADEIPKDFNVAFDGLMWFLSCGKSELFYEDEEVNTSTEKAIDFNVDHLDIWGAFWRRGIDLSSPDTKMHWFQFVSALGNLGDCPLTQKIQYRSADLSKMKGDTRKYYKELQEKYRIRKVMTKEEHELYLKELEAKNGSYFMKLRQLNKR